MRSGTKIGPFPNNNRRGRDGARAEVSGARAITKGTQWFCCPSPDGDMALGHRRGVGTLE